VWSFTTCVLVTLNVNDEMRVLSETVLGRTGLDATGLDETGLGKTGLRQQKTVTKYFSFKRFYFAFVILKKKTYIF